MIEASKEQLQDICSQISKSGFYGVFSDDTLHFDSQDAVDSIKHVISQDYGNVLGNASSTVIIDPHGIPAVLYKIDAKLFNAIPIFRGEGFDKFFTYSQSYAKHFTGIVLVSHKLKMLSLFQACTDVTDDNSHAIALWESSNINVSQWRAWRKSNCCIGNYDDEELAHIPFAFVRNAMYSNYNGIFKCSSSFSINGMPEMCLCIEDYYRNALLHEKMCISNEIDGLSHSIESAYHIIENQKQKIEDFNSKISQLKAALDEYEVNLYASRVTADLEQ